MHVNPTRPATPKSTETLIGACTGTEKSSIACSGAVGWVKTATGAVRLPEAVKQTQDAPLVELRFSDIEFTGDAFAEAFKVGVCKGPACLPAVCLPALPAPSLLMGGAYQGPQEADGQQALSRIKPGVFARLALACRLSSSALG